jgi:flagellar hook-associated protein 3 FlgL
MATATSNVAGISPFSAQLSTPTAGLSLPSVQIGDGQHVAVGIVASANASVTSTGSSSTGSYVRDIMRSLATLGSLSSGQAGAAGFSGLVDDIRSSLGGAITDLNADAGVLGNRQTQLQATKAQLGAVSTALTSQVSGVEDVDMAATLSQLTQAQTQLQASYQLIAGIQSLSLTKYITLTA